MIFKTLAEMNSALKEEKSRFNVIRLNTQQVSLSEVSELLGGDIPHIFLSDFDDNEQNHQNNEAYKHLQSWRYLYAYCYQSNGDSKTKWEFLRNLNQNQSKEWIDDFLDFLIEKPKKPTNNGLQIHLKKIHALFFLIHHFSLTAKDLSDADGHFNPSCLDLEKFKPLLEKLTALGEPFGEFLTQLGQAKLLDVGALQTLDFENPVFKESQAILAKNSELWPFLKPILLNHNSQLPPNLMPFDKAYSSNETEKVPLTDLLRFILFLEEQKQLNLALLLMKKGLLNLSILFQQAKLLEHNQGNFEENFKQWLTDYASSYDVENPDEETKKKILSFKSIVQYGLPIDEKIRATKQHFFASKAKRGEINTVNLDLSAKNGLMNDRFWLYFFNEFMPKSARRNFYAEWQFCPNRLKSIDLRGQKISQAHAEQLIEMAWEFPYFETFIINEEDIQDKNSPFLKQSRYFLQTDNPNNTTIKNHNAVLASQKQRQMTLHANMQEAFSYNNEGKLVFRFTKKNWGIGVIPLGSTVNLWLEYLEKVQASEITEIDLFYMPLSDEALGKLLDILPKLSKLKVLDFAKNQVISEENKRKLSEVIKQCPSLEKLSYQNDTEKTEKATQAFLNNLILPVIDEGTLATLAPMKELQEKANQENNLNKIKYIHNKYVYDNYIEWLGYFIKFDKQSLNLNGVRTAEPLVCEALFKELISETKQGIRSLTNFDFTSFSDADFDAFMNNFSKDFLNLECIELDFNRTSLTDEVFQTRQKTIIEAIRLLPKLKKIIINDFSYKLSPFFYNKLYYLAFEDNNKPKPIDLVIDLPLFDLGDTIDPCSDIFQVRKESSLNKESKYEHIDALVARRQIQIANEKKPDIKTIPEMVSAIQAEPLILPEVTLDELVKLPPTKTMESLRKENKSHAWLKDSTFFDERSQTILNGLLITLGDESETAEERLDFYHRFGLLEALIKYIDQGFQEQNLSWEKVKKLDTLQSFKNDEKFYYLPDKQINIEEEAMKSSPRQLPRLLAHHTKKASLSMDQRVEFDLYDINPALNPTRNKQIYGESYGHKKDYEDFLDNFFNDVLKPVAKKRIELYDERCALEDKKNQTLNPKEKKALVKEIKLLTEKIRLLSGFIKKRSAALKSHELFVAAYKKEAISVERYFRDNFLTNFPLFKKSYFEHTNDEGLSDDTYLKEMSGDITVNDLSQNKAVSKKDVSDESRQYVKDFCRKAITAFLMAVTFPVSIPAILIASKCYGSNPYGTLFKTKTGACLDGAEKKAQKLSTEMANHYGITTLQKGR